MIKWKLGTVPCYRYEKPESQSDIAIPRPEETEGANDVQDCLLLVMPDAVVVPRFLFVDLHPVLLTSPQASPPNSLYDHEPLCLFGAPENHEKKRKFYNLFHVQLTLNSKSVIIAQLDK